MGGGRSDEVDGEAEEGDEKAKASIAAPAEPFPSERGICRSREALSRDCLMVRGRISASALRNRAFKSRTGARRR